jgi:hypothetical protein
VREGTPTVGRLEDTVRWGGTIIVWLTFCGDTGEVSALDCRCCTGC